MFSFHNFIHTHLYLNTHFSMYHPIFRADKGCVYLGEVYGHLWDNSGKKENLTPNVDLNMGLIDIIMLSDSCSFQPHNSACPILGYQKETDTVYHTI